MSVQRITDFINNKNGVLVEGVVIQTSENIISDQKDWCDEDQEKSTDFSTSPYWVTTDGGNPPVGIVSDADLNELMSTTVILAHDSEDYQIVDNMTGLCVYFKGSPIGEVPPSLSAEDISRRLAVLPDDMCLVVDYRSFL